MSNTKKAHLKISVIFGFFSFPFSYSFKYCSSAASQRSSPGTLRLMKGLSDLVTAPPISREWCFNRLQAKRDVWKQIISVFKDSSQAEGQNGFWDGTGEQKRQSEPLFPLTHTAFIIVWLHWAASTPSWIERTSEMGTQSNQRSNI